MGDSPSVIHRWGDDASPAEPAPVVRAGQVPLVGRSDVLARLRAEVDRAFAGEPRAVFLAGEAGIGKSRLLEETIGLVRATRRDAVVLVGRCVDERGMPPYLPWIDALRDGTGSRDATVAGELAALLPRLAGTEPLGGPRGSGLSPEQRKLRLFDAVTDALLRLAATRPVVLAFDDLQWSDAASNELLRYFFGRVSTVPLLLVCAYRSEEAGANRDLMRTVADLDRRRLLGTFPIGGLSAEEVGRLLAGLLPSRQPDDAFAHELTEHCGGTPFLVEEIVRTLVEDGAAAVDGCWHLPEKADGMPSLPLARGMAAIVERRLDRVGDEGRAILEVAALVGRQIPVDLVASVAGLDPDAVAALLDEAGRAALVRPVAPADVDAAAVGFVPDFAFVHDRVRETIDAGINPVRRRSLHARIAAAIEAAGAGTSGGASTGDLIRLATLTHHWRLARQPATAAAWARRLGDAAMRAHAHAEAARAFRLAVELAPPATGGDQATAAGLWLALGDAALAAGAGDAADAFVAAEACSAAAGDRAGVARARRRLGAVHARREEFDLAVAYLAAALALLTELAQEAGPADSGPVEAEMAEVLVDLGGIRGLSLGRYDDAIAAGREALELAVRRARQAPALEGRARLVLAQTLMRAGRLAEGHALLPMALTAALGAHDPTLAAEVTGALANYHYWTGDLAASERAARRRQELAVQGGDPYALRHVLPWLAMLAATRGAWGEAERLLAEAEARVAQLDSPEPRAFLRQIHGFALLLRGRPAEAVVVLQEAIAGFRCSGPNTLVWYLGSLATAYATAGDALAAAEVAAEVVELIDGLPPEALPRAAALADLGALAAMRGDRDAAARIYPQLARFAGQLHWVLVDRILGMLAALLGDLPAAERHFAAAAGLAAKGDIRPEAALVLAERGLALRRSPDRGARAKADPLLRAALDRLRDLDMAGEAARVAALLALSSPSSPGPNVGLSERELEVLALLAEGLTNREIGSRLGISEKTVTNHLTNVFTKANLENRAAAVAFAVRHGLA